MTEIIDINNANTTIFYAFRFGVSDKLVHLTQQQLNRIPYLFNLVAHKDNFSLVQNENSEYVLNYPIEYKWFIPILHSIISQHPYTLLNELEEDNNIFDILQLYDYLGIDSFLLPNLKDKSLVLSNSITNNDSKKNIVYHKANISEARQTAGEFVIALSKNKYNLHDLSTLNTIYSLIIIILSNASMFSSRFRHHTLIVAEECCYSFFSKKQQRLLPNVGQITQHRKIDRLMYLYDDSKPVPDDFHNTFAWRGDYESKEDYQTDCLSTKSNDITLSSPSERISFADNLVCAVSYMWLQHFYHILLHYSLSRLEYETNNSCDIISSENLPIYQHKRNLKNEEAQLARSGHFNTLPNRPKVDKHKHRFG
ncbi:unnamed protein product [Rotaria sp. Silwood1]|nr:unnamed protein product [Rotaria sp. Silwood1]CAF4964465.1 unnamed protein product [Rotaria sp. Silwood1]